MGEAEAGCYHASAPAASPEPPSEPQSPSAEAAGGCQRSRLCHPLCTTLHGHRELCEEVGACRIWPQEDTDWLILGGSLVGHQKVLRDGQPQGGSRQQFRLAKEGLVQLRATPLPSFLPVFGLSKEP